jgi:hypothetical protein
MNPPQITVTRVDRRWRAHIPALNLAHEVGTLYQLDRWVRFTFGPGWIDYRFCTGDAGLDRLIHRARQARRRARTADEHIRRLTLQVLAATDQARFSGRDLGVLLGISHQRIQQLQRNPGAGAGRSADTLSG